MRLDRSAARRLGRALNELDIRPGHSVIDAGCGTGILYPLLKRRIGRNGRVLAVDLAERMVEIARLKYGRDRRFSWVAGDLVEVLDGLPAGSADRLVCFSAFPHFADPLRVLQAVHRVLTPAQPEAGLAGRLRKKADPAGRFAVVHLKSSDELNQFHAALRDSPVSRHRLASAEELAAVAAEVGFRILAARESPGLYLVAGSRQG
jgi:ubiquinone/menaquinone biosynthesis C-methylase UbiE